MDRVCYGPSLCRPTLLWADFAMGRVCYGPRRPVTVNYFVTSSEEHESQA